MTEKDDDPFAKTELGLPASAALVPAASPVAPPPAGPASPVPEADPFAKGRTVFGAFTPEALEEAAASFAAMSAGPTVVGSPPSDALPSTPNASHTVLGAPSPDVIASWGDDRGFTAIGAHAPGNTQPGDLGPGFTELGRGGPGASGIGPQPPGAAPSPGGTAFARPLAAMTELGRPGAGFTELGGNRPGFTIPGGVPPEDAFAPNDPRGFTQLGRTDFGAAQGWEAAAAEAERELLRAKALHRDGVAAGKAGHFAHADAMLRESLDLCRRYRPPGDILIAHGCVSLGTLYYFGRRPDLAEPLYREAWMLHRQGLGDMHPETATRAVELARALVMVGRAPEAYGLLRGAHEVYSRVCGPVHPATLEVMDMMRHLYG